MASYREGARLGHERPDCPGSTEAIVLERDGDGDRETVIDLGHVDITGFDPGNLEGGGSRDTCDSMCETGSLGDLPGRMGLPEAEDRNRVGDTELTSSRSGHHDDGGLAV